MSKTMIPRTRARFAAAVAAVALAGLLAPAHTAAAVTDNTPSAEPTQSACVGAATQPREFLDVAPGHAFEAPIDCLAHYKITVGCGTGTTFCPGATVSRWQMALFLHRAAAVAQIELPAGNDDAFDDISGLPDEFQTAINELAAAGIMDHPAGSFDPHGPVLRRDMAYFLVRFVAAADPDLVEIDADDVAEPIVVAGAAPDDKFTDLNNETYRHHNSILAASELAITRGAGDGTVFQPGEKVTREQMAAFITRALAHTNARPAGVSGQIDDGAIVVSVRDNGHAPVLNQPVGGFYIRLSNAGRAFTSDGACQERSLTFPDPNSGCELDGASAITDATGSAYLGDIDSDDPIAVWVWDGADRDTFDERASVYHRFDHTPETPPVTPTGLRVSPTAEDTPLNEFGESHTWTVQLTGTDADGDTVDTGADGNVEYTLRISEHRGRDNTAPFTRRDTTTLAIGTDGSAEITVPGPPDPHPRLDGDAVTVEYHLTPGEGAPDHQPVLGHVIYADAEDAPSSVEAAAAGHHRAPRSSDRPVIRTVEAVVYDQYGNPLAGVAVTAASDKQDSTFPTRARHTLRNGSVTIAYSYSGGPAVETITVTADPDPDVADDEITATAVMRWTTTDTVPSAGPFPVAVHDPANNEIVADTESGPVVLLYDTSDHFNVDDEPVPAEEFFEAMDKAIDATTNDGAAAAHLSWSSYHYADPDRITLWELTTPA